MIVNLRSKLRTFRQLSERRQRCAVDRNGNAQVDVFTLGEYSRLLLEKGPAWVQKEQGKRRSEMWTPQQERNWRSLRAELRHIVG